MVNIVNIPDGDTNWGAPMRNNLASLNAGVEEARSLADSKFLKPASGIPKADLAPSVQASLNKADSAIQSVPVISVAGKTGAVTLVKADVGLDSADNTADAAKPISTAQATAINAKYTKPTSGIPNSDLTSTIQTSLGKADSASQPGHTHTAVQISDSTVTGRQVLTAADQATARNALAVPDWGNQIIAGTGLSGGGNLTVSRTLSLSTASVASLLKADTAVQPTALSAYVKTINGAGPDSNGNVTLSGGGGYVKPTTGIPDTDLASKFTKTVNGSVPDVAGNVALNDTMLPLVRAAIAGLPQYAYGHSYIAGANLAQADKWAQQNANMLGLTYPTLNTSNDLMRGVSGDRVEEMVQKMMSSTAGLKWVPGSQGMVLIEALTNTARHAGISASAKTGALNSMRAACALLSSPYVIPSGSTQFIYTSTFGTTTLATAMSQPTIARIASGSDQAQTVKFAMPARTVYALILSRNEGQDSQTATIKNLSAGTTTTFVNQNQGPSDALNTYIPVPIRIDAAEGDVITIGRTAGANTFLFDGLLVPDFTKAPIIMLMKEPYLADYTNDTNPLGSDAVLDYYNDIFDTMAKEFPNVVVANPNTAGYWDKTTMIQTDKVHPTAAGAIALANTMRDAVYTQVPKMVVRRALGLI